MRVAIVGCGLIGNKRARATENATIVAAVDRDLARAQALAKAHRGCVAGDDWRPVVARPDVAAVVVATTNDALAEVALAAVQMGKHVLLEKPGARRLDELRPVLSAVYGTRVVIKVGFNHRFHPGLAKAHDIFASGALGPLMYVRARYGHGGRVGYDREWRADPEIAGGGELLDQGVHLVDLTRWFAGDITEVQGHIGTFFWNMPVEDNGFLFLRARSGAVAWLHASCTEWKNTFSFEVTGRDGKLQIDGLGGSYGVERLTHYRMLPEMGLPETTAWEYPGEDRSWRDEWRDFQRAIREGTPPLGTLEDAMAALAVVEETYRQARART